MHTLDILVQHYFLSVRTPVVTEYVYLLSTLFDVSVPSILVCLCVGGLVYLFKNIRYALLFVGDVVIGAGLVLWLKSVFNVARPSDSVIDAFGQSFPSYHAAIATIFFVMLMYIFDEIISHGFSKSVSSVARVAFNVVCTSLIFLVAFSRVYLGVHWVSDVFGGIVFGLLICLVSVRIFEKYFLTS